MMVMTLAPGSWTAGHVILWQQDGNLETQWFPITAARDNRTTFLTGGSAVVHALHETTNGQWELGIVYDAAPFGSGSPTARFALLGLEEGEWHLLWDSGADEGWRGSHGRVEFPQGDLSEMVVRSDSWRQRGDVLPTVIHESTPGQHRVVADTWLPWCRRCGPGSARRGERGVVRWTVVQQTSPGPHSFFVETWLREGDRSVLAGAETVAGPYATLVEFIYILGTGDDAGAREYVTDAGLVERAREHGLAGVPRQHWLSTCESGLECGKTEPIRFDPRPTRGEPQVAVYFEERDGRWLISYIQPESGS